MISIRWRLTILLCLVMGSLLVVTGVGVFMGMRHLLIDHFDQTLTAKATALITASEIDGGEFEIDLKVQDFAGFGTGGGDYFEIRRMNGDVFLRSPSLISAGIEMGKSGKPPQNDEAKIREAKLGDERPARFYIQRFYPKGDKKRRHQDLYLIVASPLRGLQVELALLGTVLAVAGGLALFVMVPLVGFGLARGLRPLGKLAGDVRSIPPDGLHQRLATERIPEELVPVAVSLNDWLERLEASFERERRFSSNAAHELRTPLAELKSMAELGATWPEETTPERCAEMVTVANEMEALLEKLSLLARTEAGRQVVGRESLPLDAATATVVERFEGRAAERGLALEKRIGSEVICTDPMLWGAILQNLLGNAVSHSPAGSTVVIEVSPGLIAVSNPAPDLESGDLPKLFERFWRKDEARSGYGHSGLGMSIVRACATLLGGECHATLSDEKLFRVEVVFPAAVVQ
ncbi:ATP-binding protein [Haloferula sp. BvORR071]|uniref:sensor histidine kinase n=1 Tax=Haloferula sp. BvORR071 TaxID=1396141 RepID=UPI0005586DAA|nr:ATP-binding protein [Haloferula sp. BvORR071]